MYYVVMQIDIFLSLDEYMELDSQKKIKIDTQIERQIFIKQLDRQINRYVDMQIDIFLSLDEYIDRIRKIDREI